MNNQHKIMFFSNYMVNYNLKNFHKDMIIKYDNNFDYTKVIFIL